MKAKHLFTCLCFVTALAFNGALASAQVLGSEKSLHGLKSLELVIEDDGFDPADGLSAKLIREDVAKILSAAGIKILTDDQDAPGNPLLNVRINIWKENDGSALVSVEVNFEQDVTLGRDPSIELSAITWTQRQLVTTGKNELSKSVREKLASMVEKFTADYKEENQSSSAKNSSLP